MVARLLWEQDVAGSNPVIPTKTTVLRLMPQAVVFYILQRLEHQNISIYRIKHHFFAIILPYGIQLIKFQTKLL